MSFINKNFGFQILGPFYVVTQMLGLLLVKEIDDNVLSTKKVAGNDGERVDGRRNVTGMRFNRTGKDGVVTGVFLPDRRYFVYNAFALLLLYSTLRRCATLVGGRPCGDGRSIECSSAVEWTVTAVGTVQAMASVVVATVHRQSRTVDLLNHAYDTLIRRGVRERRSHLTAGVAYAVTALAVVLARSVAVVASRPERFSVADVVSVYLPAAIVPIAVECAIVCVCLAAENVFRDVVEQLDRLANANAASGTSRSRRLRPVHWRLEAAWRDYWRGCRLVGHLSRCYGLDLATNLIVNMLFFIVYAYVALMSVYTSMSTSITAGRAVPTFYWNVALVCQLLCISFRIVFISYRAEKIKQVATNVVLISLRNLLKNDNLDISSVILINSFTYQIVNRELKVSACGLFSVNLSFFHGLIRLATTYLIVIIQYNSEPKPGT